MFKHYFELIENVSVWPVISLAIFFGFFITLIWWLFKVDKKYLKRMSNLPLDEESSTKSSKSINKVWLYVPMLILPAGLQAQNATSGTDMETMVSWLVLIVVIIAILVLMVAIYTLLILKVAMEKESGEVVEAEVSKKQWNWFWERFNKSVPQSKEATILLDHDYDGIKELDNHLPPWWTAFFYISIVFGVIYMFVYHVFDAAPLPGELYEISVAEAKAAADARLAEAADSGGGIDESTVTFSDDPALLENGKKVYDMQCASCHRNDGGGNIGPNLTDKYWLHGGSISDIYKTIRYGVPQKGMISWEPLLSPEQMRDVSSYILSIAGSNPANAKEPQGEPYEPEADSSGSDTGESA